MLAVALMAGSVLVLAGCNDTPAEPEVITGDEVVVQPEILPIDEAQTGEVATGDEVVVQPVVVEQPVKKVVAE